MAKHVGKAGKQTRRLAKKRAFILYGYLALLLVLGFFLLKFAAVLPRSWSWLTSTVGFLGLGLWGAAIYLYVTENKNIDESIDRALRGSKGEEKAGTLLSGLPDEYLVFHDISCPVGNIDHVVLGPTGIFIVETKSHSGTITASAEGKLLRNGKPLEKDVVKQVWQQVSWLKKTLKSRLEDTVFIHPLLVFVNGFVQVRNPVKGITVIPGKWLVETITNKKNRLAAQKFDRIQRVLWELSSPAHPKEM
ncbi:MAG TPA: NERD domain-containing protein [Alicyclobacillus sp.]|nr:NERD domain-containing protein [Alicyclobacillus sp.]